MGSAAWDGLVSDLFPQPVEETPGRHRNLIGELSSPEAAAWQRLATALSSVHEQRLSRRALGDFAEWVNVVVDFSLHPWR